MLTVRRRAVIPLDWIIALQAHRSASLLGVRLADQESVDGPSSSAHGEGIVEDIDRRSGHRQSVVMADEGGLTG
jgi:hypothetical protein